MSKTQPSKLDAFAAQLDEWFGADKISLEAAREKLRALGCSVSASRLSEWWSERQSQLAQREMLDRIAASSSKANLVVDRLKQNPANVYEALFGMISQAAFEKSMNNPSLDVDALSDLANLTLSHRSLQLKEKEISLKRDRFEFDAAAACLKKLPSLKVIAGKTGLDQKEKINQIRLALFGVAPE